MVYGLFGRPILAVDIIRASRAVLTTQCHEHAASQVVGVDVLNAAGKLIDIVFQWPRVCPGAVPPLPID
jgi:hypothetical protein